MIQSYGESTVSDRFSNGASLFCILIASFAEPTGFGVSMALIGFFLSLSMFGQSLVSMFIHDTLGRKRIISLISPAVVTIVLIIQFNQAVCQ